MKNVRILIGLGAAAVLAVAVSQTQWHGGASTPGMPVADSETVEVENGDGDRLEAPQNLAVVDTASAATSAIVSPVPSATQPQGVYEQLITHSPELTNDVELAYQLGEDFSSLTPEALAKIRADWEQRVR
ncbi:MAG: hypothetical protein FJ405_02465 [Verrucomicrobia bacterium]|nr:hypothetical protein [Verrucomicrobiota bacterium]